VPTRPGTNSWTPPVFVKSPYSGLTPRTLAVRALARAFPFKTRIWTNYFNIPWMPFAQPLTQRVSKASENWPGWLQHDLAIFAGVDLEAATERDIQHIRSAAERRLPIMICGGRSDWGTATGSGTTRARAPGTRAGGAAAKVDAAVVAAGEHPILRGLPRAFGRRQRFTPLSPPRARRLS